MNPLEERLRELGYDPAASPMAAAMLAKYQRDAAARLAKYQSDLDVAAWFTDLAESGDAPDIEPVEWGCCDDPQPAILETNNRLFCRNCRRYLDRREDGGASDDD